MGNISIDGVTVSFLHRDAALVNDEEYAEIKSLVAAERESLEERANETLTHIEFISDDVSPLPRYNTVSNVPATMEDVYDE